MRLKSFRSRLLRGRVSNVILLVVFLSIFLFSLQVLAKPNLIRIQVSSSTNPLVLTGKQAREFAKAYKESAKAGVKYCLNAPGKIIISSRLSSIELNFLDPDHVYLSEKNKAIVPSERFKTLLNQYYNQLQREGKYGQLLTWELADKLFPRFTYAWVEDQETGMRFRVQRRAGSQHADVQPLTAGDTEIMKKIYNGEWSWRRRAIILEVGTDRIAASMNGMPHGGGQIKGNEFKGHFCIHFLDSKTHGSNEENLAHQMMVWKAAGRIGEFIDSSEAERLVLIFFTALEQNCLDLALKTLEGEVDQIKLQKWLDQISSLSVAGLSLKTDTGEGIKEFEISLVYSLKGQSGNQRKQLDLLTKQRDNGSWRIDADCLNSF